MSDNTQSIKRQLNFYFSDANITKDKFMLDQLEQNNNRIPVATILTFSKLKNLGATIEDCKAAAAESEIFDIVDEFFVRRNPIEQYNADERSVVLMNLTEELRVLEDLENFIREAGFLPAYVRIREQGKSGSFIARCELGSAEEAEKAVSTGCLNKEGMETKSHADYEAWKAENAASKEKAKPSQKTFEEFEYTKGTILVIEGLPEGNNIARDDIKEFYSKYGRISFVNFASGDSRAEIRFAHDAPTAASTAASEAPKFQDAVIKYRVLEGEEETNYYRAIYEASILKAVNRSKGNRRFGGPRKQRR